MDSRQVTSHRKAVFAGDVSRNWLVLGRAVPPGSSRPQVLKRQNKAMRQCPALCPGCPRPDRLLRVQDQPPRPGDEST